MNLRHVIAIVGIGLLLAVPAMGQRKRDGKFQRLDKNHDGVISRDEFPGKDKAFARLDRNNDGVISLDELKAARAEHHKGGHARLGKKLKTMDTNGDGKISRDEWRGKPEKFQELDTNGDGFLTPDELRAARHHRN